MWVIVMFDLPTGSKDERKRYTDFRRGLLDSGFIQLQYSVYARYTSSPEKAATIHNRIVRHLPPKGEVRLLSMTDNQFSRMQVFQEKTLNKTEAEPEQLAFFSGLRHNRKWAS